MSDHETNLDWSNVDVEMARQILHQGETFLRAQLDAALASDQRAMTSASIFIGFATAVLGAGLAQFGSTSDYPLLIGASVGSGFMYWASICCFISARPVDFYYPGNHPEKWWPVCRDDFAEVLCGETENYQEIIDANDSIIASNQTWLWRGIRAALVAPILGLIAWLLLSPPAVAYPA